MSKLYFYNYNNYYNRIVKKGSTLLDYGTPTYTIDNANFYEADGCNTKHTINISTANEDIFNANYLLVLDSSYNIKSRWFVTEVEHNRNRQYICSLRRDLIVDFYDSVINDSPVLIEKALVSKNNPLIFNSEGFDFNQIKKDEILLNDMSETQWGIIYTAKNVASTSVTVKTDAYSVADLTIGTTIENSIFGSAQRGRPFNQEFEIWTRNYFEQTDIAGNVYRDYLIYTLYSNRLKYEFKRVRPNSTLIIGQANSFPNYTIETNVNYNSCCNNLETDYTNEYPTALTKANETLLNSMNNKLVEDSTGKIYKIKVTRKKHSSTIDDDITYNFAQYINTQLSDYITQSANNSTYEANFDYYTYEIEYNEQSNLSFTFTLDPASKSITNAEYNVIAMPLNKIVCKTSIADPDSGDYTSYDSNKSYDNSLAILRAIGQNLSTNCYDIQILPYCPLNTYLFDYNVIDINEMDNKQYQQITDTNGNYFTLFFVSDVNSTFNVGSALNINAYTDDDDLNVKISNECDMYRLVSPNYQSQFEFSVAKNNGVIAFNVDMTLKPYNPYIHINPIFKGLYGVDFNDTRGLILSGDFSLPIINDQWRQYELQNKNYQNIFDRKIQHMDKENKLARTEAGFGAVTGAISGGISGAVGGAGMGGIVGAIGGGAIGGLASAIGGGLDYNFLKRRQNENKDYAIDMFTYNLGNIKALPYSLSKNNPFSYNYKGFPFIEYFSCTDEEKDILVEKIKYNSMTVMSIGYIKDYLKTDMQFIKGTLIRFISNEAVNDHEIVEIFNELKKGVFI